MYLERAVVSLLNLFPQHFNLSPCNYKFPFMHLLILSFCSLGDMEQKLLIFKGKYRGESCNCQEKFFKYTEFKLTKTQIKILNYSSVSQEIKIFSKYPSNHFYSQLELCREGSIYILANSLSTSSFSSFFLLTCILFGIFLV